MENFATKDDVRRLELKLAETKTEILKWLVGGAFVVQTLVLLAALFGLSQSVVKF